MDRDLKELHSLGFFGIFKESFKVISSSKNIFSKITISLILPLTFIFLGQILISSLIFDTTLNHDYSLDENDNNSSSSSNSIYFWLFRVVYFLLNLILSLLSTAAVVYTVACIYTTKPITFKRVMGVVPKVWKRLLVTFLWNVLFMIGYTIVMVILIVIWAISLGATTAGWIVFAILVIFYAIGFVYIYVIWELASVVSVLEMMYGLKAMKKSRILIKGKLLVAGFIFVVVKFSLVALEALFEAVVVGGDGGLAMVFRVLLGIGCFVLILVILLLELVLQTVIYFVCKSCHNEIIDKSSLAEHLEGYQGDYVRLRARGEGVQLQLQPESNV